MVLNDLQNKLPAHLTGTGTGGNMSDHNLRQIVQDFLNFFPPELVQALPKLKIFVGNIDYNGSYHGGRKTT